MFAPHRIIDLGTIPLWSLWLTAAAGLAAVSFAALRIAPPDRRRRIAGALACALLIWFGRVVTVADPAGDLWMTMVGAVATTGPLLWLGPVPAGVSIRDPASWDDPRYVEAERRGRLAGFWLVGLIAAGIFLSVAYVGNM